MISSGTSRLTTRLSGEPFFLNHANNRTDLRDEEKVIEDWVTLTGDVHRGVSPGPPCEGSHPISNARKEESICHTILRNPHDAHLAAEGIELA